MTDADNERIIQIHTALFGVPNTEETGLVGRVNDMIESVTTLPCGEALGKIGTLLTAFKKVEDKMAALPCDENSKSIKRLEEWKDGKLKIEVEEKQFRVHASLKLWHGILALGIAAVLNTAVAVAIALIVNRKP